MNAYLLTALIFLAVDTVFLLAVVMYWPDLVDAVREDYEE